MRSKSEGKEGESRAQIWRPDCHLCASTRSPLASLCLMRLCVCGKERERLTDRLTAFPRRDVLRLRESAEGHETREKDATR